jgi:hypothetical protein
MLFGAEDGAGRGLYHAPPADAFGAEDGAGRGLYHAPPADAFGAEAHQVTRL